MDISFDVIKDEVDKIKKCPIYKDGLLNMDIGAMARDVHDWYQKQLENNNIKVIDTFKPILDELLVTGDFNSNIINLVVLDMLCFVIVRDYSNTISKKDIKDKLCQPILDSLEDNFKISVENTITSLKFIRDYFNDELYVDGTPTCWFPIKNENTEFIPNIFMWILDAHPLLLNKVNTLNSILSPDSTTDISEYINMCLQNIEVAEEYDANLLTLEY